MLGNPVKMDLYNYDEIIARNIQDQLNCTGITENAVIPREKENYRPKTLVDQTLEYIDPTPNIHTLFMQFNRKYFWNALLPVQVKWSPRMTSCAGTCTFHSRNKECIIALSAPLLKLRPRKDLIETLLHEMIHAYLFLTNNNRDRDGHGPVFQSHMKRINKDAGTNITIYHSFHEEVKLYQQHWWRCDGPCQKRAPYFGMVKRAMNRAPGPYDFWWNEHKLMCGGQFTKIREPEKVKPTKVNKGRVSIGGTKPSNNSSILTWVNKTNNKNKSLNNHVPTSHIQSSNKNKNNSGFNVNPDLKQLSNSTKNVFGWGIGGPNSSSSNNSNNSTNKINSATISGNNRYSSSGTLGGSNTGKSNLLDKFSTTTTTKVPARPKSSTETGLIKMNKPSTSRNSNINNHSQSTKVITVECPNCCKFIEEAKLNEHLDMCLLQDFDEPEVIFVPSTSVNKRQNEINCSTPCKIPKTDSETNKLECPLCSKKIASEKFTEHFDDCFQNNSKKGTNNDDIITLDDSGSSSIILNDSPHICFICNKVLKPCETLNDHLEECIAPIFNDIEADFETGKTNVPEVLDRYPCPVCMELVKESLMNEHLDVCIKR